MESLTIIAEDFFFDIVSNVLALCCDHTGRQTGDESRAVNHFRPHPWHGLEVGPDPPEVLNAYIEITPFESTDG